MGLLLDGSNDWISFATSGVTDVPLTLGIWFYPLHFSFNPRTLIYIQQGINGGTRYSIELFNFTDFATLRAHTGSTAVATTAIAASYTGWNHCCGVFASTTDRRIFVNGGSKATNTTSATATSMDKTNLGESPGGGSDFHGTLAEGAIWNVALTDDEVAILGGGGVSALQIRPDKLMFYAPLFRNPWQDWFSGINATVNGGATLVHDHPSIPSSLHLWTPMDDTFVITEGGGGGDPPTDPTRTPIMTAMGGIQQPW